jgi:superfamily II DNA or RNA helicase
MELYKHQKEFLDKKLKKALICFEIGTGKTFTAVEWLRDKQENALVIVPKRIKGKWGKDLGDVKALVVTKEEFKKIVFKNKPSALVIDEAHNHNSPLFTRQRSQLATKTYDLIKKFPDMPVLLLTGTPVSSSPANLHTLLCYIGKFVPWDKWRNAFYNLEKKPYLPYPAWIPKKNWRKLIQPILLKHTHTALMSDCVDYLPPVTEEIVKVNKGIFFKNESIS